MGWSTVLDGAIHLSRDAYRIYCAIPVDWSFGCERLADYVEGSYDAASSTLTLCEQRKLYHHRAFFNALAYLKDLEGTDQVKQTAPTYEAWFNDGIFYVERGRWCYSGIGMMTGVNDHPEIVGDGQPRDWNAAIPLAKSVTVADEIWLDAELWSGETIRAGVWNFAYPPPQRLALRDGGASIDWDGVLLGMDELLRFREG